MDSNAKTGGINEMAANFYGPDPSYHKARQAFVHKRPALDTVCPDRGQRFHGAWRAFNRALQRTTLATLMVSVLSLNLAGCQSMEPNQVNSLEPVQSATAASAPEPTTPLKTLEVRAVDLAFQPHTLSVAKPGRYLVKLINTGSMPHDMTFPDGKIILAPPGETASARDRGAGGRDELHLLGAGPFPLRDEGGDPGRGQ